MNEVKKKRLGVKGSILLPIVLLNTLFMGTLGLFAIQQSTAQARELTAEIACVAAEYAAASVDPDLLPAIVVGAEDSDEYQTISNSLKAVIKPSGLKVHPRTSPHSSCRMQMPIRSRSRQCWILRCCPVTDTSSTNALTKRFWRVSWSNWYRCRWERYPRQSSSAPPKKNLKNSTGSRNLPI